MVGETVETERKSRRRCKQIGGTAFAHGQQEKRNSETVHTNKNSNEFIKSHSIAIFSSRIINRSRFSIQLLNGFVRAEANMEMPCGRVQWANGQNASHNLHVSPLFSHGHGQNSVRQHQPPYFGSFMECLSYFVCPAAKRREEQSTSSSNTSNNNNNNADYANQNRQAKATPLLMKHEQ